MTAPSTPATPQNDGDDGKTAVQQGRDTAPRLPHEHDQSSESQDTTDGKPTREGKQALKDLQSGQVDTDRGPVTDRVYNDKVKK
ncbi:hypothetical protein [Variovorax ginsengisoli]|uniref:Uncharacterized protein n=1 Tax=Variovorax ginsengisoli TaxID=363844 RepID=A0ABT9S7V6_9BURK|nr:hypothetical protein [Variovorax ginsengisoli]MDP9900430.1 hypothetical protein [Variovorax ginsengisoli]